MQSKNNKLIKGSATLVVIFAALATSIYMISTFADYEHFNKSQNSYANNLKEIYAKRVESVDEYYKIIENKLQNDENYILE